MHILEGDGKGGGGHSPRSLQPRKSKFPSDWSDQRILNVVAAIAADETIPVRPTYGGRTLREAEREGIVIRVLFDTTGCVITAYPVARKIGGLS